MYFEPLGRHLFVCSLSETFEVLKRDRNFWNVVSIHEPELPRAVFRGIKKVHYACFHDVENVEQAPDCRPPQSDHLKAVFGFVDSLPGGPVLIQCRAGVSRSPAVALGLIVRALLAATPPERLVERAAELLLAIRPASRPNALVLRLGLAQFLPEATAQDLTRALVNHPVLFENRFVKRW